VKASEIEACGSATHSCFQELEVGLSEVGQVQLTQAVEAIDAGDRADPGPLDQQPAISEIPVAHARQILATSLDHQEGDHGALSHAP
jgi:hypothetical protein